MTHTPVSIELWNYFNYSIPTTTIFKKMQCFFFFLNSLPAVVSFMKIRAWGLLINLGICRAFSVFMLHSICSDELIYKIDEFSSYKYTYEKHQLNTRLKNWSVSQFHWSIAAGCVFLLTFAVGHLNIYICK